MSSPPTARVFPAQIGSILFLDWRGDPVPKRLQGDLGALAKAGSALGARQSETRREGAILHQFRRKESCPYSDTRSASLLGPGTKSLHQNGSIWAGKTLVSTISPDAS
jgi:hypothetical protein